MNPILFMLVTLLWIMTMIVDFIFITTASPMTESTRQKIQAHMFTPNIFLREAVESFCGTEHRWKDIEEGQHVNRFISPNIPPFYVNSSLLFINTYELCIQLIAERYFSVNQGQLYSLLPLLDGEINRKLKEIGRKEFNPLKYHLEGNIMGYPQKYSVLQSYINDERVETICEIGFNAGYSTLFMLLNNPKAKFYEFDIFYHNYSSLALTTIQEMFPERDIHGTVGDSSISVPRFHRMFPSVSCNVIFIDGGHGLSELRNDINNMAMLANRSYHRLLIDDTPYPFELYGEYMEFPVLELREDIERNMYRDIDPEFKRDNERVMETESHRNCVAPVGAYRRLTEEDLTELSKPYYRRQKKIPTSDPISREARLRHIGQHNVDAALAPCFTWQFLTNNDHNLLNFVSFGHDDSCDSLDGLDQYFFPSGISVGEYLFDD